MKKTRKMKLRKSTRGGASANSGMIPCSVTPIRGINIQSNLRRYLAEGLTLNLEHLEDYSIPLTDYGVGTYGIELREQRTLKNILQEAIAIKLKLCSHKSPIYMLFEAYFTSQDGRILTYNELNPLEQRDLGKEFYNDTEKDESIKVDTYYNSLSELRKIAHRKSNMRLIWIPCRDEVPERYMRRHDNYNAKQVEALNREFGDRMLGPGEVDAFMGPEPVPIRSISQRVQNSARRTKNKVANTLGRLNRTRRSFTPSLSQLGSYMPSRRSLPVANPLAAAEPFYNNGSGSNDEPVVYPSRFYEQPNSFYEQ